MTPTSLYRNVIKEAWWMTWRHKFLWFFGIFVVLLGSNEIEILFRSTDTISRQQALIFNLRNIARTGKLDFFWNNITDYLSTNSLVSIIAFLIILIIFVFVVWLAIVSQIGLIDSYFKLQAKQAANLESGFRAGRKYFIPIFLLNLLGRVIISILIVAIPLIFLSLSQDNSSWNTVFIIFSLIILVPLAIIAAFIIKYAVGFVVFKQARTGLALKDAWKLFTKNWLISIEMAILMFALNFLFWIALIILVGIVSLPFILVGAIFNVVGLNAALNLLLIIGLIALLLLVLLGGGFFYSFYWVAWITLFKLLVEKKGVSKIVRMFNRLPEYLGKT